MESHLIEAGYVTPFVRSWLARRPAVRVLHVFDHACNLINERSEIVSLVTAELGPGPFAVVLAPAPAVFFSQLVTMATPVAVDGHLIKLGGLVVDTAPAVDWPSRPAWEQWRRASALVFFSSISTRLRQGGQPANSEITVAYRRHFTAGRERLLSGLAIGDADACREGAQKLAGLGPGLTPAGDDFLMGATYGLWATQPAEAAQFWGQVIAETAAPRTTLLSAAWLRAAARGEAAEAWHELVRGGGEWRVGPSKTQDGQWAVGSKQWAVGSGQWAVNSGEWAVGSGECESQEMVAAVKRILNTGHSSGADALAGFTAVLEAHMKARPRVGEPLRGDGE